MLSEHGEFECWQNSKPYQLMTFVFFQVYNTQGSNESIGKAFKVHLQLWDTAGQER